MVQQSYFWTLYLSVSNSSSLGALVLSVTPQTDESSFKEERINYLSVSALSSSVCTSLLTLSNLFCWLCAVQTDAAAPRCEAGWRVEGGGVAAGNERQIHQTKEVWEFKRQKERDLWRTWREIRCRTERQISDVLTGSEQTDAAFLSRHRHLQPADGGGVVYSGSIWTQMFSKTCRERGEKNIVWVRVDTSWSCWVWLHPRTCTHKHEPVSELDVITDIFNMLLSPDTVPSCCKSSPSTPACQLFHQRMSNPLPATHSLHNVNNNKNCVLKSANFTQRQQLHSHIVQHQHCFSKSDTLQTQLRTGTWKHGMKAPTLSIYLTPVKWIWSVVVVLQHNTRTSCSQSVALRPNIGPHQL